MSLADAFTLGCVLWGFFALVAGLPILGGLLIAVGAVTALIVRIR